MSLVGNGDLHGHRPWEAIDYRLWVPTHQPSSSADDSYRLSGDFRYVYLRGFDAIPLLFAKHLNKGWLDFLMKNEVIKTTAVLPSPSFAFWSLHGIDGSYLYTQTHRHVLQKDSSQLGGRTRISSFFSRRQGYVRHVNHST